MRKFLLLLIILIAFISCKNQSNPDKIVIENNENRPRSIGKMIDSIAAKYPNIKDNTAQKDKFNLELKKAFADSLKNKEFLKDYEFKLEGVKSVGNGYTLNLQFNDRYGGTPYKGTFNLIGVTNDKSVERLIEGNTYKIKAEFIGYYNDKRAHQLEHAGSLQTPVIGYFMDGVDLGVVVANLDTIY